MGNKNEPSTTGRAWREEEEQTSTQGSTHIQVAAQKQSKPFADGITAHREPCHTHAQCRAILRRSMQANQGVPKNSTHSIQRCVMNR